MALASGTRLGPYEIVSAIGAGGMGEVYKAIDANLKRAVAIKILPPSFAGDAERLARFAREARVLASLNHPNIAAIYHVEETDGVFALVMELVEGEDLSQRIARGAIPLDEALPIAKQIAEALEAAHKQGIIHRDLKPANIKVRGDGTVKVLDFGLAKLAEASAPAGTGPSPLSMSPTITSPAMMTGVGVLLGTAAYMSPEQARGKPADKRADIWAFGCVLFEMLTGRQTFAGGDVTDFIVAINTKEPDWSALPTATPMHIRRALRRCLEKDSKRRLRDIGDARLELENPEPSVATDNGQDRTPPRRYLLASTVLSACLAAMAGWFLFLYFGQNVTTPPVVKLQLVPPERTTFGTISISPDGRRVAFTAVGASGNEQLWVRQLDSVRGQPLPNTDGASYPFWSPDSRFVGFFAKGKLKKIDASGGTPQTICELVNNRGGARGGTWNRDGIILFTAEPYGPEPIYQVSAAGGEPKTVAGHEPSEQQNHHHWPTFLPDGRHFLYFAANNTQPERTGIYLASLDTDEARLLIKAETSAAYALRPAGAPRGSDYIFFVRERTLMAQPFDRRALNVVGDPVPLAVDVGADSFGNVGTSRANFSISETGVLVYADAGGAGGAQLTWLDRTGKPLGLLWSPGINISATISPDGKQVAVQREDGRGGADIWLMDVARGTALRFTSDPIYHAGPTWSPDGKEIVYFAIRDGRWQLWEKPSDGGGEERLLLKTNTDLVTQDVSPDGRFLLYGDIDPKDRKGDLSILFLQGALEGQTHSVPFVHTPFDENFAEFSPDGKWVVYQSDESGRYEVYVRPVRPDGTAGAGKWQISTNGGIEPHWPRGGKEIFYISPDNTLNAVDVKMGGTFEAGVPHSLFSTRPSGVQRYNVASDGQRFLVSVPSEATISAPVTVVLNWFEELKRLVPTQ